MSAGADDPEIEDRPEEGQRWISAEYRAGRCLRCGAPVLFIKSAASDKFIPVDQRRRQVVDGGGVVRHGYEAHFATCKGKPDDGLRHLQRQAR